MTSGSPRSRSQYQSSTLVSPWAVSSVGRLGALGGPCILRVDNTPGVSLSTLRMGSGGGGLLSGRRFERPLEDLGDVVGEMELHLVAHLGRDVVQVGTVAGGEDDLGQPRSVGGQDLLLDPADRQHAALQGDLAG